MLASWIVAATGCSGTEESTATLADLAGVEWVLTHFDREDPAPAKPAITLVFEGESVCLFHTTAK